MLRAEPSPGGLTEAFCSARISQAASHSQEWAHCIGSYVRLHVGQRAHEFRGTLTEIQGRLCPADFLRIHHSTIVNIQRD